MTLRPALLSRLGLTLAAALTLAACSGESPAPTAAAPAGTSPAAVAPATDASAAPQAPVRTPGPIVPPSGPAPVAGTDYTEIPGGQPFQPGTGKIEVVEVFGYTCPACAGFEPLVSNWAAKLPADVQFTPVAAPFGGFWMPYAKAFYAAETMGVLPQTHDAMFHAVHVERSLPVQPAPTNEQLAAFYGKHGVDAGEFARTLSSFAINAKLNRAQQFLQRSGVESTPTLVVDGKYRVSGQTWDEHLRIAEHLIARERAARQANAPAQAPAGDSGSAPENGN